MQHTIYFGHKPLTISSTMPEDAERSNLILEKSLDPHHLQQLIKTMAHPQTTGALLLHPQPDEALAALKEHFQVILAAGGLVVSEKGNMLLIFRKGKWDLPKGKLDPGENLEACAVREVKEETGLRNVMLQQPLKRTYHTYHQDGQHMLKESHWYLMQAPEQQHLQPQTEEDIEQAIWVVPAQVPQYLPNTHPNVVDVLQLALSSHRIG